MVFTTSTLAKIVNLEKNRRSDASIVVQAIHEADKNSLWVIWKCNFHHDTHGIPWLLSLHMIGKSCFLFETLLLHRHSLIENQLRQSTSNSIKKHIHRRRLSKHMSDQHSMSLSTLPIELVYRILDHLTQYNILISAFNVCTRWNSIIDTYQPYQVTFTRSILWFFNSRQLKIGLRPCAMWKREKQWLSDLSVTFGQSLQSLTVSSWRMLTRQNSNFCTIIPSDLGTRKNNILQSILVWRSTSGEMTVFITLSLSHTSFRKK